MSERQRGHHRSQPLSRARFRRRASVRGRAAGHPRRHLEGELRRAAAPVLFDEVISFRVGYGGVQERYGGEPDLTTLGKIIGGGFPVGATGGRAEVMAVFDPGTRGPRIASGGTFSANPVSMTAGLATLEALDRDAYMRLAASASGSAPASPRCSLAAACPES